MSDNVLASVNLTQAQVERLLAKSLIEENEELSGLLDGKKVFMSTQWQTSKWSDPNAMVYLVFVEDNEEATSLEDDSADDTPAGDSTSTEQSESGEE